MIIALDSKQVDNIRDVDINTFRWVHTEGKCNVANLKLTYDQFTKIESCETFEILIIGLKKSIKLSRCVKCAWGYVNEDGYTLMQINYWESKFVDTYESRDILIECLIEE